MTASTAHPDRTACAERPRILVVDDEPNILRLLSFKLGRAGYDAGTVATGEDALRSVEQEPPDVLLLDLKLPGIHGLDVLRQLRETSPGLPVIVLTAEGSVEVAVEAMKLGARDFLLKPLEMARLEVAVANALEVGNLRREVADLRQRISEGQASGRSIIGRDGGLRETFLLVEKVVPTDLTVLMQGESGTGKELIARAIHDEGPRRHGPFVAINCAALPESLLESELFGTVRGAYTGAETDRAGHFEAARGGTLLLDEVGEMSSALQAKLLRTLQEATVTRLGSSEAIPIDVRIVCATNRDLEQELQAGRFRRDLYYRLAVFPVAIPPLRERTADIPPLCRHVLDQARSDASINPRAMEMLEAYRWPGNVRELQNVMRRAAVLADHGTILPEHLTLPVQSSVADALVAFGNGRAGLPGRPEHRLASLEDVESMHIRRVLEACSGNLSQAARTLGIGRTTLYRKLQREPALRDAAGARS